MKYYDMVISLGQNCHASMVLRNCSQQRYSYPLDWSAGILWDRCGVAGLPGKVELICHDFQGAFEREDFVVFGDRPPDSPHYWVKNLKTGLQYQHDFPVGRSVDDYFPEFREKYRRRISRHIVRYNVAMGESLYDEKNVEKKNTVFAVVNNHFVTGSKINNMFEMLWKQQHEMEMLKEERDRRQ